MSVSKEIIGRYKLKAAVNYPEIRADGEGLYMWLDPDEDSTLKIMRIIRRGPFKPKDGTEMHCTVMYCKDELPDKLIVPEDQVYSAVADRINFWEDHKGRSLFVLSLVSPQISSLHASLVDQGLPHGHSKFNPHITLAKDFVFGAEARLWLDRINSQLAEKKLVIKFSPQLRASPLS